MCIIGAEQPNQCDTHRSNSFGVWATVCVCVCVCLRAYIHACLTFVCACVCVFALVFTRYRNAWQRLVNNFCERHTPQKETCLRKRFLSRPWHWHKWQPDSLATWSARKKLGLPAGYLPKLLLHYYTLLYPTIPKSAISAPCHDISSWYGSSCSTCQNC